MKVCAVISRNDHCYASRAQKRELRRVKAHKNLDFVLETPENRGSEGQKSTKMPILCTKGLKMGVLAGKSAQKPQFCAREEGKVASGSVTVVWNAKPWPGMQTRGPEMQEGGLNLGHPLGWLRERCERCAANVARAEPVRCKRCAANDAMRTMRCRCGSEGALVVLLQVLCYRVGDEGESIHVPSLRPVGVNLCRFLH